MSNLLTIDLQDAALHGVTLGTPTEIMIPNTELYIPHIEKKDLKGYVGGIVF